MSLIERECPTCEGSGAVYLDDGEGGTDSERCDTCAGDGRIVPASDHQGAAEALRELVRLKDGPRDDAYRAAKDAAWDQARTALHRLGLWPSHGPGTP
jgi:hypothetical protein